MSRAQPSPEPTVINPTFEVDGAEPGQPRGRTLSTRRGTVKKRTGAAPSKNGGQAGPLRAPDTVIVVCAPAKARGTH